MSQNAVQKYQKCLLAIAEAGVHRSDFLKLTTKRENHRLFFGGGKVIVIPKSKTILKLAAEGLETLGIVLLTKETKKEPHTRIWFLEENVKNTEGMLTANQYISGT